jgi:hypothetical protein
LKSNTIELKITIKYLEKNRFQTNPVLNVLNQG